MQPPGQLLGPPQMQPPGQLLQQLGRILHPPPPLTLHARMAQHLLCSRVALVRLVKLSLSCGSPELRPALPLTGQSCPAGNMPAPAPGLLQPGRRPARGVKFVPPDARPSLPLTVCPCPAGDVLALASEAAQEGAPEAANKRGRGRPSKAGWTWGDVAAQMHARTANQCMRRWKILQCGPAWLSAVRVQGLASLSTLSTVVWKRA